jgi:hypothetical protein
VAAALLRPVDIVKSSYRQLEQVLVVVAAGENGYLPRCPPIDTGVEVGTDKIGYIGELTLLPSVQNHLQVSPAVILLIGTFDNKSEKLVDMIGIAAKPDPSLTILGPGDLVRRRLAELSTGVRPMLLHGGCHLPVRHEQIRMYPHPPVLAFDYQIGCRVIISFYVLRIEIRWRR